MKGEGLGDTHGRKAGHEPTMSARSPESQLYPGLHQKQRGQQVEGGGETLEWVAQRGSGGPIPGNI